MSPRAIVAFVSVAAIVIGVFLSLRGLIGGPDFVTPAGAACDPAFAWQDDSLGDCFAVERHSPAFALVLAHIGLLGLIYARLLMTREEAQRAVTRPRKATSAATVSAKLAPPS